LVFGFSRSLWSGGFTLSLSIYDFGDFDMTTEAEHVTTLNTLKGWASAIVDVIDRHEKALITGEDTKLESQCVEQPRPRLARLCHQIEGIHNNIVVPKVYDGKMPEFHLP
jgi:hypothetical protein